MMRHLVGIWAVKRHSYECQKNFGGPTCIGGQQTILALVKSVSALKRYFTRIGVKTIIDSELYEGQLFGTFLRSG